MVMPKMGESITEGTIIKWLKKVGETAKKDEIILEISTDKVDSEIPTPVAGKIAELIAKENIIGWFQGRMEFGPRALGNRSIIGDARSAKMQSIMNLKIKFRESFRPFAPTVLKEFVSDYFDLDRESPYMLLVVPVKKKLYHNEPDNNLTGFDKQKIIRSEIPAITHVDYSARVQTINEKDNPRYYNMIKTFYKITGCPVVINTSFNVRGEPIVCIPEDAYRCFMRTNMDYLIMGNFLLDKKQQEEWKHEDNWQEVYELD